MFLYYIIGMGIQKDIRLSSISSQGQRERELPKARANICYVFPDSNLNKDIIQFSKSYKNSFL